MVDLVVVAVRSMVVVDGSLHRGRRNCTNATWLETGLDNVGWVLEADLVCLDGFTEW